jgi:hypothetical protein
MSGAWVLGSAALASLSWGWARPGSVVCRRAGEISVLHLAVRPPVSRLGHGCSRRPSPAAVGNGFILLRRVLPFRVPSLILPPLAFGRGSTCLGFFALFAMSPEPSTTREDSIPTSFRPQAFSTSRRFAPLPTSRACFIPLPRPGFPLPDRKPIKTGCLILLFSLFFQP